MASAWRFSVRCWISCVCAARCAARLCSACARSSPDTAPAQPDVVLVPCVGFTREGFRLGYGGGYFDRWLAAHPHVMAVGLAWREAELTGDALAREVHDQGLALVVTPDGVVG